MLTSRITQKGQATIPSEIRNLLSLHTGDNIMFSVEGDKVTLRKIIPFDLQYAQAIELSLTSEWESKADDEAYNDL
jgi:antitoxin PrlF